MAELSTYMENEMFLQNQSSTQNGKKICETIANSVYRCFYSLELSTQMAHPALIKRKTPRKSDRKTKRKSTDTTKWVPAPAWDPGDYV